MHKCEEGHYGTYLLVPQIKLALVAGPQCVVTVVWCSNTTCVVYK